MPICEAQALVKALRGRVSGLCQPTYMLDLPGGHGKSPIGPNYLERTADAATYKVTDYRGRSHLYPPAIEENREIAEVSDAIML